MKFQYGNIAGVLCVVLLLFGGCRKNSADTTKCNSILHGYTTFLSFFPVVPYACDHGIINLMSADIATAGTFPGRISFSNEAAFDTASRSYYVFGYVFGTDGRSFPLYKIDVGGNVTPYYPSDSSRYSALVYNQVTNKLYCIKDSVLAEIFVNGSSYSASIILTQKHSCDPHQIYNSLTVDNVLGDIYYVTGKLPFYVEKYNPQSHISEVVFSDIDSISIAELRYNKNDNMLYAMKKDLRTQNYEFIKIDPAIGNITTLSMLGSIMNPDFHSSAIDLCANRYILSTVNNRCELYQFNMNGAIVQYNTTKTFYQGLVVAY